MKFLLFCNHSGEETKIAKREKNTINIPFLLRVLRPIVVPLHFSGFDGVNLRQVSGDAVPFLAFVCARPDLTAGRAEINSDRIAHVSGHRLSKDGEPRLVWGQSFVQPLPGLSAVAGDVCGGLTSGRGARPNLRPVHRENPDCVGIARVQDHRKADVADRFRHLLAYANPARILTARARRATIHPVNAAMVLLIEDVRIERMHPHAMRIVAVFRVRDGDKIGRAPRVEWLPVGAFVHALKASATGTPNVHGIRVAGFNVDRWHLRPVRRAVAKPAGPRRPHWMSVESGERFPGVSAVFRTEQPLRRRARVPDSRLARVPWREPEDVINHAPLLAFGRLGERGRLRRLFPRLPEIPRAEYGGPQMPRLRRHQHRSPLPRVERHVMNDVAQKDGAFDVPLAALVVGTEYEPAFLGRNE